jgi:hypothetical protein
LSNAIYQPPFSNPDRQRIISAYQLLKQMAPNGSSNRQPRFFVHPDCKAAAHETVKTNRLTAKRSLSHFDNRHLLIQEKRKNFSAVIVEGLT